MSLHAIDRYRFDETDFGIIAACAFKLFKFSTALIDRVDHLVDAGEALILSVQKLNPLKPNLPLAPKRVRLRADFTFNQFTSG